MEILQGLPFWAALTREQQALLTESAENEHYAAGALIANTAQTCKGVLVVRSGGLRAYIVSPEGREVTIYRLHAGDICALSASCLLTSIAFAVNIEATEPTQVLRIPTAVFHTLQQSSTEVELFLLRESNRRFSDVMWTLQQILFFGADRRVAAFLVQEAQRTGSTRLNITHELLARYIGSAREVVTRILNGFAEDGMVRIGRGHIDITDIEKLRRVK